MRIEPFCTPRRLTCWNSITLLAVGWCALWPRGAAAEELRTWSDVTGKFKVKAKFIEVVEGKVKLEREDGKLISVPLEKLNDADRKVVAELQAEGENPFKEDAAPAKKPMRPRRGGTTPANDEQKAADAVAGEATLVKPRWADATQVMGASAGNKWKLSIDASKVPAAAQFRAIPLPGKRDFFEHAAALVANPFNTLAVAGYTLDAFGRNRRPYSRIVIGELATGKVDRTASSEGKFVPLALSDSGGELLMRHEGLDRGNPDILEIWEISASGITRLLEWSPHDGNDRGERKIKWARYVDKQKVLTLSGDGKLTLWNSAKAEPLWWVKMDGGGLPAISPDRRYVAFVDDKAIGVVDLATGEIAALQSKPASHLSWPILAFTPKGTRLVCGAFDRVFVFDVATGALYREIPLAGRNLRIDENLLCPSEEHVLLGKTGLLDVESQAKAWSYEGHELVAMRGGVCLLEIVGGDSGAIIPAVIPHPGALDKIQKALDDPDFFVLKPGVTVKLNVAGLPDPGERDKAAASLTAKLAANGFQVGPTGSIELVASAEAGKRREIAFRSFGRPVARVYTVQEYWVRLKFIYQGQTAWEMSVSSVPGFITHLEPGETMEEHLKKSEHPNYQLFSKVELPKLLQKPTSGADALGVSQVTTVGLRDGEPQPRRGRR